jgi:hypothetical protein
LDEEEYGVVMFEAHPLVIEWFSVIIVTPLVLTFVGLNILKRREPKQKDEFQSLKRFRLLLVVPYVLLYILVMLVGALGFFLNLEVFASLFPFILLSFQIAIIVGIGFVSGLIIAAAYETLGVAGYVLSVSLLASIPIAVIYTGQTITAINIGLDTLDSVFIVFLIFSMFTGITSTDLFRVDKPDDFGKSALYQRLAAEYIRETERNLNSRIEMDSDAVAHEILRRFEGTEGELGLFIRKTLDEGLAQRSDSSPMVLKLSLSDAMFKPKGSWTLNANQFFRKSRRNRILYFILLIPLLVLLAYSMNNPSLPENQWAMLVTGGIIVLSIPLTYFDRMFLRRRMNADEGYTAVLRPLKGIQPKVLLDDPSNELHTTSSERGTDLVEQSLAEDVRQNNIPVDLSMKHADFLERVSKKKGGPIIERGSSFYRLTENLLETAISYLDIKEAGIDEVGDIWYPPPPRHLAFLSYAGPYAVKHVLERLSMKMSSGVELLIEKEVLERNKKMALPMAFLCSFVGVIILLSSVFLSFLWTSFGVLLIVATAITIPLMILYVAWTYRKLKKFELQEAAFDTSMEESRVTSILQKLNEECTDPFRFLLVRNHTGIYYTGRVYTTSRGIQLREAVFLPPVSSDPNEEAI